jgi:RNA polymerase sigma factor (sigma-70 family)
MQVMDDMALLREYAARNSEAAFETLVSRRVGFVYSAALRQVRDPHLAEEVTQAVFIILAQKAGQISDKTILTGWLFKTTRFTALAQRRAAAKRRQREQEAQMQSESQSSVPDLFWEQMSPLLDEALATLGETDRQAVLLRFFENKSLAEVGNSLGTGEDTARKRVSRALEKLHRYFNKRGVSSTTAIIAGAISANSVQAAPVALAKTISAIAVAKGVAASGSTLTLIKGALKFMAWTKAKMAVVVAAGVILAAGTTTVVVKAVHSAHEKAQAARAADLFKNFVAEKRAQVAAAAAAEGKEMPAEYGAFFAAAEKGNMSAMERMVESLGKRPPLTESSWEAMMETCRAFEMFSMWDEKYALAFAHGIIESIPPGSVYFTGVPMGAFLIPALQKSEGNADPCFTLDQGELVDESYRTYLRNMYGGKINVPTEGDVQKCFQDYSPDALLRYRQNKLQREDFQRIDRLIAKVVFDQNPDREFYFEEAWPVEWMQPYLEPHGLILKINRQPLSELSDDMVAQDHDFWIKQLQPMIGDWLTYDTPVQELVAWTERVRLKHDFSGFTGDRRFIENIGGEQQIFSKLRTAIGGVYAWRADHAANAAEKERMTREADFAFRQALALWPCSGESCCPALRYATLLEKENRRSDARLIQDMAQKCSKQLK